MDTYGYNLSLKKLQYSLHDVNDNAMINQAQGVAHMQLIQAGGQDQRSGEILNT